MNDCSARLQVCVLGPFRVESSEGVNLTPKGAKNQALLALLALGPNMSRPRRWLADKLWSNFGAEQASANLRQALSKLRSALGPHKDILITDRHTVSLNEAMVDVDLIQQVVPEDERAELLQGLDARDPEFSNWLRIERLELQKLLGRSQIEKGLGVQLVCHVEGGHASLQNSLLGEVISNRVGETISESVSSWRKDSKRIDGVSNSDNEDFLISTQVIESGDGFSVFLKVMHSETARIVYSKALRFDEMENLVSEDSPLNKVAFEAADHVLGRIPRVLDAGRPEARATALLRLAQYRMFSLEEAGLREAQALALQAFQIDENGMYLAWAGLSKALLASELGLPLGSDLSEDALDLCRRALELASDNALVRAVCARIRVHLFGVGGDVLGELQSAVESNFSSGFAWEALAHAQLLAGDVKGALMSARRGSSVAAASPFKQWWDLNSSVVAAANQNFDEAALLIESARQAAPRSRIVLRHELAIRAAKGDLAGARDCVTRLEALDPRFSVTQMIGDASYPVANLRAAGLVAALEPLVTISSGEPIRG